MPIVAKKTNGMLHDVQWKSEYKIDKDDIVLVGWDRVPSTEELATLHDTSYIEAQKVLDNDNKVKKALESIDLSCIRPIRELLAKQFPDFTWTKDGTVMSFTKLEEQATVERAKLSTSKGETVK